MNLPKGTALKYGTGAGVLVVALLVAIRMPWLITGYEADESNEVQLGSIAVLWLTALILVAGVAGMISIVRGVPAARYVAVLALVIVGSFSALSLIAVELFSNLLSEVRLLSSITKIASGARSAGGPWWTLLLTTLAIVAIAPNGVDRLHSMSKEFRGSLTVAACLSVAGLGGIAYVNLRMSGWISGNTGGDDFDIPGASLPFLGSMSFISTIVLFVSALAVVFRFRLAGALGVVLSGWIYSLTSAFIICLGPLFAVLSDADAPIEGASEKAARLAESTLPDQASEWIVARIDGQELDVSVMPSTWIAFACGLLVCAAGLALLRLESRQRSNRVA